jgi:hypothetical protein
VGFKGRDVEVVQIDSNYSIVTACDSCGGVGLKKNDIVKVPPYISGRFTARVAIMEVLSINAIPKTISIAICNEPSPTGNEIISGVVEELKAANLDSIPMTISTEKNIETSQTALGITVVGICNNENIRAAKSKAGDYIYSLGVPKVGNELNGFEDTDIVQINHIMKLLKLKGVSDIVPIGSKGILKEIEMLCKNIGCKFIYEPESYIDVHKSAGPSTCLIFTCSEDINFSEFNLKPLKLGILENL